jgi:FkbM family methyltransferase
MRLNLLTNFGPKAVPINAAVGGCSMSLNVPFTSGGTGDRIHLSRGADDSCFCVPMRTLDDLLNAEFPSQKIDLLKMDIEGCEWDVLETGQCERLRDCHHLLIEVHPHSGRGLTDFQKAVKPYGLELREVRNAGAEDVFLFSQNANTSSESSANH